jgi:hypothetical protein
MRHGARADIGPMDNIRVAPFVHGGTPADPTGSASRDREFSAISVTPRAR